MFQHRPPCDICKKATASVYVTRISNGHTTKQRLCEACARQHGSNHEWLKNLGQQNDNQAPPPSHLPSIDETIKKLLSKSKPPEEQNPSIFPDFPAAKWNLPAMSDDESNDFDAIDGASENLGFASDFSDDELDDILSEMESALDEALGEIQSSSHNEMDFAEDDAPASEAENDDLEDDHTAPVAFPEVPLSSSVGPMTREFLSARCTKCGTTWDRLRQDGRAGCAQCYVAFEAKLVEVMGRMQRHAQHTGKAPRAALKRRRRLEDLRAKRDHRLEMLNRRLQEAIAQENYEDAAALRDKIKIVASTIVSEE